MKKRRCKKCGRLFMPTNLYDYTCEICSIEDWLWSYRFEMVIYYVRGLFKTFRKKNKRNAWKNG